MQGSLYPLQWINVSGTKSSHMQRDAPRHPYNVSLVELMRCRLAETDVDEFSYRSLARRDLRLSRSVLVNILINK
jgi:hypothetical protein